MVTIEQINAAAEKALAFGPEERQRLIEPYMGFLEGVNELRDDQVLHLITLKEYHATLTEMARMRRHAYILVNAGPWLDEEQAREHALAILAPPRPLSEEGRATDGR